MSDTTHPKAIEAQERAAERKQRTIAAKAIVAAATAQGFRFIEITPINLKTGKPCAQGRMTLMYRFDRRNVVALSTTLCHPNDSFNKLEGRARAAVNFGEGHVIVMRVPNPHDAKNFLRQAFTVNTYE